MLRGTRGTHKIHEEEVRQPTRPGCTWNPQRTLEWKGRAEFLTIVQRERMLCDGWGCSRLNPLDGPRVSRTLLEFRTLREPALAH